MQNQAKPEKDFITSVKELASRQGTAQPASLILKDYDLAATASKLVKSRERGLFKPSDPEASSGLVNSGIELISKSIMTRIEDNENIFKLFPDIELAAQIVISSILSPKDMINSELIYGVKTSSLPPQLTTKLVQLVGEILETEYNLEEELPDILRKSLFQTGSSIKAILPEAAVDNLINQNTQITTESIYGTGLFADKQLTEIRSIGILGDPRPKEKTKKAFALESIGDYTTYQSGIYIPGSLKSNTNKDGPVNIGALAKLIEETIEVTDNYQFLKMPRLMEQVNKQTLSHLTNSKLTKDVTRFVTENFGSTELRRSNKPKITASDLEASIYKSARSDYKPMTVLPNSLSLPRHSTGKPLVMDIPSEACIPVFVPGDPSNHVGYFIALDEDGNPVTVNSYCADCPCGGSSVLQGGGSHATLSSLLTEKAKRNLGTDSYMPMLNHMSEIYADLIENDLLERLSKGAYNKKLQLSGRNEIYRIMLARTMANQFTRIVYIPAEYITYFAFNYHRNGVGKSYLDDLSNLTSLRAMVLFSKVMAKVRSSIANTHVHVQLDERDPDPLKTIEMSKHLAARSRQSYFPHGLNRVVDLTDWIQSAGIQVTYDGHPRLPGTKFEFESKNISHVEPDDTLDETFRHQTYMHFGLSPETVDSAARADFATTIEQNSVLFSRRIQMLSNIFCSKLTEYAQKLMLHDEDFQERLVEILNEHKGELENTMSVEEKEMFKNDPVGMTKYILNIFIEVFEIDLPKPDSTTNASLSRAMKEYEEMVDQGINYIISGNVLPEVFAGKSSEYVDTVKEAWKAEIMRRWMAQNNFVPELFDITNRTEEGKPMADLLDITTAYSEGVMLNVSKFLEKMQPARAAVDQDLENITGEGTDSSSDTDSSSSDDSSDDTGGDDFGGDDGFGDMPSMDVEESGGEGEEGEGEEDTGSAEEASSNPFEGISSPESI